MNITLSASPILIEKTRSYAEAQGKTLNGIVRVYMESLVAMGGRDEAASEFSKLALNESGCSESGYKFDRADAHAREII